MRGIRIVGIVTVVVALCSFAAWYAGELLKV